MVLLSALEAAHQISAEHAFAGKAEGMEHMTHVCKDFFGQPPPLALVECFVEAQNTTAPLQTIACHLEFVHGMDVLDMQLDAWAIWGLCGPHVEVFVSTCFEIQCVVAVVEVGKFREEAEVIFGVELRIYEHRFEGKHH